MTDPTEVEASALIRSVGTDLEACTAVDLRIGSRAGELVLDRLRAFGETPVGAALVTPGGDLKSSLLIHVVIRSPEEPISKDRIERAFRNGLRQAAEWGVEILGVPPLGIGAGNLDAEVAARVMCRVIDEHLEMADQPRRIVIVAANAYEEGAFRGEIAARFPSDDSSESASEKPAPWERDR